MNNSKERGMRRKKGNIVGGTKDEHTLRLILIMFWSQFDYIVDISRYLLRVSMKYKSVRLILQLFSRKTQLRLSQKQTSTSFNFKYILLRRCVNQIVPVFFSLVTDCFLYFCISAFLCFCISFSF